MITATAARRRFVAVSALLWLAPGLQMATMVLLLAARGADIATISLVMVTHGVVVTALELPTGGVSDVIGRRGVIAASALLGALSAIGLAFATATWLFLTAVVLKGVARALSSGSAEAWYVDTVRAADATASLRQGLSQGHAAGSVALAVGTVIGGALPFLVPLPDDGFLVPLAVPMLLAAAVSLTLLVVAVTAMPEPPRTEPTPVGWKDLLRGVPATVAHGLQLGLGDSVLRRLLLTVAVSGLALYAVETFTPLRMADLTDDATTAGLAYGVATTVGFAASALGSTLSPWLADRLSLQATAAVGAAIAALSMLGLAASGGLSGAAGIAIAVGAYAGLFIGLGIVSPVRSELLHDRISSSERATILSVDSLALQGGGVVGAFSLAYLASSVAPTAAWWVAGGALLAAAGVYLALRVPTRVPSPAACPTTGPPRPEATLRQP